jgi:murein DD-endopeptidase MepM/ murein hydrolase activator NlpD
MHIILMSDRLGRSTSLRLDPRHALLAGGLFLATLIIAGLLGARFADPAPDRAVTAASSTGPEVDQLAMRVGELQARLDRLTSIGERVAAKTGVPLPDAGPAAPGRGGPLVAETPGPASAADLARLIERLGRQVELASDHLLVLDAELLLRQASQGKLPMDRPVAASGYVSSVFGSRNDPFTGQRAQHNGLDFADTLGAPILAAESGVVLAVTDYPQYGKTVDIDHGNGLVTRYSHTLRVLVKQGDVVKRGQAIAEVGSTGRSTGPHLHFEVLKNGAPQNPIGYLSGRS